MPRLTIRLVNDPETGKKNIIVDYESEEDAMPMEHEDTHRELVDKLIEGGTLKASEVGKVIVSRDEEQEVAVDTGTEESQDQRDSVEQKS
jgi:hypothetical protein